MSNTHVKAIQVALTALGYDAGPADGLFGPRTSAALRQFDVAKGRPAAPAASTGLTLPSTPPWVAELLRLRGLHEVVNNDEMRAWLRSDGHTLGDPAKLPWCGDAVETAIRLTLPQEPFPGPLGQNPYWVKNWTLFGKRVPLQQHAVVVFSREGGGHVGFLMGRDSKSGKLMVLGGNQRNTVSIAPIDQNNLIGVRWPLSYPTPDKAIIPSMNASGVVLTNGDMQ